MSNGKSFLLVVGVVVLAWCVISVVPVFLFPGDWGIWKLNYPMTELINELCMNGCLEWIPNSMRMRLLPGLINSVIYGVIVGGCVILVKRMRG